MSMPEVHIRPSRVEDPVPGRLREICTLIGIGGGQCWRAVCCVPCGCISWIADALHGLPQATCDRIYRFRGKVLGSVGHRPNEPVRHVRGGPWCNATALRYLSVSRNEKRDV